MEPCADGETYEHERDHERIAGQRREVWGVIVDRQWHTLSEISVIARAPEASVSARLRDFRKEKFGGHQIERRYVGDGLWEYRLGGDDEGSAVGVVDGGDGVGRS